MRLPLFFRWFEEDQHRTTQMRGCRSVDLRCEILAPRIYASGISHLCRSKLTLLFSHPLTKSQTRDILPKQSKYPVVICRVLQPR
jgi:hypothetical protein